MQTAKPIFIIDDDPDDLEMIEVAFQSINIKNEVQYFKEATKVLDVLKGRKLPSSFHSL